MKAKQKQNREFVPEKDYSKRSRDTEYGSCSRKIRYISETAAKEAAKLHSHKDGTLTTVYECKFCDGWHRTKEGVGDLELPAMWKDKVVFFDERGPFIKVDVICLKCGVPEQGMQRLSVVGEEYSRAQGIEMVVKDSMIHPKKGSKSWVHANGCPETPDELPPAMPGADGYLTDETEKDKEAEKENGLTRPTPKYTLIEVPFSDEVLIDAMDRMDSRSSKYDPAHACGIGWLILRGILEKRGF